MPRVGAVFGISGVGKSWHISRFAACRSLLHVPASELIRQEKADIEGQMATAEALRTGSVLDNQALLVRSFRRLLSTETRPILFDGHSVIDTDRELLTVPVSVIRELSLDGMIFILGNSADIARRRATDASRVRPFRNEDVLSQHQELALAVCRQYQSDLAIPLHIVPAGDTGAFTRAVESILHELI